jgi:cytochrome c-type biogenesis protein CcmH/NrfF
MTTMQASYGEVYLMNPFVTPQTMELLDDFGYAG